MIAVDLECLHESKTFMKPFKCEQQEGPERSTGLYDTGGTQQIRGSCKMMLQHMAGTQCILIALQFSS